MLEVADERPPMYRTCNVSSTSGDPGTGTVFHEFSERIWAFHKRNANSEKKRDHPLSQH